jgi:hypothetical protein
MGGEALEYGLISDLLYLYRKGAFGWELVTGYRVYYPAMKTSGEMSCLGGFGDWIGNEISSLLLNICSTLIVTMGNVSLHACGVLGEYVQEVF